MNRHPLEERWGLDGTVVLDAIESSIDLIQRGILGVVAEHQFKNKILDPLPPPWKILATDDHSVDYLISDGVSLPVSVQVKLQRRTNGTPIIENGCALVETQKSRSRGKGRQTTRLYQFGDFDIVAVSLWPLTGDWGRVMFAAGHHLKPAHRKPQFMAGFQAVSLTPDDVWTDNFLDCAARAQTRQAIRETERLLALDFGPPPVAGGDCAILAH